MVRLLARYDDESGLERAIDAAGRAGFVVEEAFGPVPVELPGVAPSPVRRWVLAGGISGALSGIALTVGTAWDLPLRVGGKPIVSVPPFLVVVFELTVLLGALAGVAGFLVSAGLPRWRRDLPAGYQADLSVDGFGLRIRCEHAAEARRILEEAGARTVSPLGPDREVDASHAGGAA